MLLLVTVVEAGSFTGAAARLGKTKSAVSQGISRLEDNLGVILLHRTTRQLSLTEEGARFLAHCQSIAALRHDAVEEARAGGSSLRGRLTLTAPTAVCATLITPLLTRFLADNPEMAVEMIGSDHQLDLVDRQIDLAIRVGAPTEMSARQVRLGSMRDIPCATPDYVAARGGLPAQPEDLAGWDHVASAWQGPRPTLPLPDGPMAVPRPRIRCASLVDSLQLARQGLGVALLPDFAIREDLARGRLVALVDPARLPAHGIYALHRYDRQPPRRVSAFLDLLRVRVAL